MWRMTLKQRRRHGELMAQLDARKKDPYLILPKDYVFGENPEEDARYQDAIDSLNKLVEEIHSLEMSARHGD